MKFSVPLVMAALSSGVHSFVAAEPASRVVARDIPTIVQRDYATANSVLSEVKDGFGKVSAAADAFNGDAGPLKKAATDLLTVVDSSLPRIQKMTPLSTGDCLKIIGPAGDLKKQGNALADKLKARKDDVKKAGECGTTYDFLDHGYKSSGALIAAISEKVPSAFKGTVKKEGDEIANTLKDTRDYFADCK